MFESSSSEPQRRAASQFFRNPAFPFVFVRLCLYLILQAAVTYALRPAFRPLMGQAPQTSPRGVLFVELLALLGTMVAALGLALCEGRKVGAYGLPFQRDLGKHFAQGAVFGVVEISAVLGALAALGYYRFGPLELHGAAMVRWALIWAVVFLIVGLFEEFSFRGYVQFTLAQAIGFWPAAAILSFLFGMVHRSNPGETPAGLAGVVLTGLFWCFTLRRTGNLWFAVGMHASFDFGETFLYSVPDSGAIFPGHLSNAALAGPAWLTGGSAGPEASLFDFIMIAAFFYMFHRLYPAKPEPPAVPLSSTASSEPRDSVDQFRRED